MASTQLEAVITLDDQITSGLKRVTSQTNKMSGKFANAGKSVAGNAAKMAKNIGLVTTAVGAVSGVIGNNFVNAASDLEEAQNAVKVVFGNSSDVLKEYSKTAAQTAGLAKSEFLEAATPIGAAFTNMGKSQEEAAKMSITLAERAADLSSVFNKDLSVSITAIQAGLRGEAEPLEQFGVNLSAANVEAKALSMGLAGTAKELTDSQKQTARYNLLLEESKKVSGDFQNTSDDLANSQRILSKNFTNLKADIGQGLLPVKLSLVKVGLRVVEMIQNNREQITAFGDKVKGVAVQVADFAKAFAEKAIPKLKSFHENQVKPFIATVKNEVVPKIQHWMRVIKILATEIADFLQPFIEKLVNTLQSEWKPIMEVLIPIVKNLSIILGAALVGAIAFAVSAITTVIEKLGSFARWIKTVQERLGNVINFIKNFGNNVAAVFQWLYDKLVGNSIIPDMLKDIKNVFTNVLNNILDFIKNVFDNIWGTINHHLQRALNTVSSVFDGIWSTINHHVQNTLQTIDSTFHEVWGTINHWVNKAWDTVTNIFSKIKDTVFNKANDVWGTINHVFAGIPDMVLGHFDLTGKIARKIFDVKKWFSQNSTMIKNAISSPFDWARRTIESIFSGLNIKNIFGSMIRNLPNGNKIYESLPSFASGTNNFNGGFARVGERGPENIFMPKGSRVTRASESRDMGGDTFNVSINNPQVRNDDDLRNMEGMIEKVLTKVQRRKRIGA